MGLEQQAHINRMDMSAAGALDWRENLMRRISRFSLRGRGLRSDEKSEEPQTQIPPPIPPSSGDVIVANGHPEDEPRAKEIILLPENSIVFGSENIRLSDIPKILQIAAQPGVGEHFIPPINVRNTESFYDYCKGWKDNEGDRPTTPDYAHPVKVQVGDEILAFMMIRSGGKYLHGREMMYERVMVDRLLQDEKIGTQMILAALKWSFEDYTGYESGAPADRVKIGIRQAEDVDEWHHTTGFFKQFGFLETRELEAGSGNWSLSLNQRRYALYLPLVMRKLEQATPVDLATVRSSQNNPATNL